MRLLREIYLEIRARLGDDVPIGVKLNCDDFSEDGFTVEEAAEVAGELSRLGVDFIEVSGGGYRRGGALLARGPARTTRRSPRRASPATARRIREATGSTPLALVDGFSSLAGMQAVVRAGSPTSSA